MPSKEEKNVVHPGVSPSCAEVAHTGAEPSGRIGGYAPGNYFCVCHACGIQFDGDKRAISCRPCAIKAARVTEFAKLIRQWREANGLSLSEAARRAGITKAHLHDMEAGRSRNPTVSTLMGLAKAYDGSMPYMAHLAAKSLRQAEGTKDENERRKPCRWCDEGWSRDRDGDHWIVNGIGRIVTKRCVALAAAQPKEEGGER